MSVDSITRRGAFSLLEVIIATAILAASTILLLSTFSAGQQHGRRAERRVVAQMLCQSKLNEILAAPESLRTVEAEPIVGFPMWAWSASWEPAGLDGLVRVEVQVFEVQRDATDETAPDAIPSRGASRRPDFALVRLMRAPTGLGGFHDDSTNAPSRVNSPDASP